jgi:apolipoprotein N-acyltransferase
MAVFRAAENRRWLLRAANTGISAIVDPAGRVRASTDLMTRTVLLGTLAPRRDRSPYAVTGDLLAWACVTLTALSGAAHFAAFKRQDRKTRRRLPHPMARSLDIDEPSARGRPAQPLRGHL